MEILGGYRPKVAFGPSCAEQEKQIEGGGNPDGRVIVSVIVFGKAEHGWTNGAREDCGTHEHSVNRTQVFAAVKTWPGDD